MDAPTQGRVAELFTRSDGSYAFARWGRPIAPVVFGADDATLSAMKGAVEAVVALAGHRMGEIDPELGANFLTFFVGAWDDLTSVPGLDRLVPDLDVLLDRLRTADANQYRIFRFDEAGAIRAVFAFLRVDDHLGAVPAETVALSQAVQSILLWSDTAFLDRSALAALPEGRGAVLRPEIGAVIRAAYDPVMPAAADHPAHAHRLAARMGTLS